MDTVKIVTSAQKTLKELIEHIGIAKFKIAILQSEYDACEDEDMYHCLVEHKIFLSELRSHFKKGSWILN